MLRKGNGPVLSRAPILGEWQKRQKAFSCCQAPNPIRKPRRADPAYLQPQERRLHTLSILALDGVVPFDLGIACEVFGHARTPGGEPGYLVQVCAEARKVRSRTFALDVRHGLGQVAAADTVVIPGMEDCDVLVARPVLDALLVAWQRGARLISICSGAFVLA